MTTASAMSISDQQLHILHHTLGLRPDQRDPYRSHFVAGPGHDDMPDLEELERLELMKRGRTPAFCNPADVVFHVTDAGRDLALRLLPPAPKRTRYEEYLDADSGYEFHEFLGINKPEYETRSSLGRYEYRMRRWRGWYDGIDVQGEWARTKKEAKASYKQALQRSKA